jgi:hypothetical protein
LDVSEKECSCRERDEAASNWHGITGNSKCGVASLLVSPVKTVPHRIAKAEKQSHEVRRPCKRACELGRVATFATFAFQSHTCHHLLNLGLVHPSFGIKKACVALKFEIAFFEASTEECPLNNKLKIVFNVSVTLMKMCEDSDKSNRVRRCI